MRKFTFVAFILLSSVVISVAQSTTEDPISSSQYVTVQYWSVNRDSIYLLSAEMMIIDSISGKSINKDSILLSCSKELVESYRKEYLGRKGKAAPRKEGFLEFFQKWASVFMSLIGLFWLFVFPLHWYFLNRKINKILDKGDKMDQNPKPPSSPSPVEPNWLSGIQKSLSKIIEISKENSGLLANLKIDWKVSEPNPMAPNLAHQIQYCAAPQNGIFQPSGLQNGKERLITFVKTSENKATFTIAEKDFETALTEHTRWFSETFCDVQDRFAFNREVKNMTIIPGRAEIENGAWALKEKMKVNFTN